MAAGFWLWLGKVVVSFFTAGPTAYAWVNFGIKIVGLALLNQAARQLSDLKDRQSSPASHTLTIRSTVEHQKIIYGNVLVSGVVAYMNTAGTNNQSLHVDIILAGHEINDIVGVWLDDDAIPNATINWADLGQVTSGKYRGVLGQPPVVYFRKFLGTDAQVASPMLISAFSEYTSNHRGRGFAHLVGRFDFFTAQEDVWKEGQPQNIKALVQGKKVYDPRSDSTQSFGVGPHRLATSGTWQFSNNPALCWADYMIDNQLGFAEDPTRIDYGYVASAANVCDTLVQNPASTLKRFTCNGVLSTGDTHANNIRNILSSFNGTQVHLQGRWKIRAYTYVTPVSTLGDDQARSDIEVQLTTGERDRFNTVRGQFIDPNRQWTPQAFPEVTNASYITRDNSEVLYRDIQLPMTTDQYEAQRLAKGILEQGALQAQVVFPSNFKTLAIEVGDTVKYSNAAMGWTDKVFRATKYKFRDMGGIDIVLDEDDSTAYTDVGSDEYSTTSGGIVITSFPTVPAPTSLTAESRLEGIFLKATPPSPRLYEYMRFDVAPTNSQAQAANIARIRADSYLYPVSTHTEQYFWCRAENAVGSLSLYFPNSDQTNVFTNVSTPLALVYSESLTQKTVESDWATTPMLVSVCANPGQEFNFNSDISVESMLYHKAAMNNTPAHLRIRFAVGTPDGWATLGITRDTVVNSVDANYVLMKRNHQSNINTNHYYAVEAIADYDQVSEWVANSYSNITVKLVPTSRKPVAKLLQEFIIVDDFPVVGGVKTIDHILTDTIVDVTDNLIAFVPTPSITGDSASDVGNPNYASHIFNTDGTRDRNHFGTITYREDWVSPKSEAANYQIQCLKTAGTTPTGDLSDNTWLPLTSRRQWILSGTNNKSCTLTIGIRRGSSGSAQTSATYTIDVEGIL